MAKRNINIDIMKIISMLMIVILHMEGHGNLLYSQDIHFNFSLVNWTLEGLCLPAVNLFVIITGYLMINKDINKKRCLSLYASMFFYSVVLFIIFSPQKSIFDFFKSITPFSSRIYWFMTNYFILYLLIPFLNAAINNIKEKKLSELGIIAILFFSILPMIFFYADINQIIGGGTGILWFIVLYCFGAYFRKYDFNLKSIYIILIIIMQVFLFIFIYFLCIKSNISFVIKIQSYLMNYNSLNNLLLAIAYFFLMNSFSIKTEKINKIITILSTHSIAVYLIHDNPYVRSFIWNFIGLDKRIGNALVYLVSLVIVPIMIFTLCIVIDIVKDKMFFAAKSLILNKKGANYIKFK